MRIPTIQMPANPLGAMPNAPSSPAPANPSQQTALPIEDIHLPADVSPWPPALGWWLLVLITALLVWGTIVALKKYRKKWGYRREALRLLAQVYADYSALSVDSTAAAAETTATLNQRTTNTLLSLVKRTAMSAYPEQDLQSLYGEAWVRCLNRQTKQPYFDNTVVEYLTRQQYQTAATSEADNHSLNIDSLYHACQQWIKKHHIQFQQEAQ